MVWLLALVSTAAPVVSLGDSTIPVLNWTAGRSDWLNVKTGCGAAGDGSTDDTQALMACIARISNNGGWPLNEPAPGQPSTLYFPAGTYVLSQTLTLNETQGKALVGHGETSILLWKGPIDGIMLRSDGAPRQIYMGLSWAGDGVAGVAIDHNSIHTNFETRIRHSNEKFTGFRNASIRVGYNTTAKGKVESAEILYENCVFADSETGAGLAFLNFNDYDNTVDGCHFTNLAYGVQMKEHHDANAYIRNCRFERSSISDVTLSNHASSIRRSVSVGSAAFVTAPGTSAWAPTVLEDNRVHNWTSKNGAIQFGPRGPLTAFDNIFSKDSVSSGTKPIRFTTWPTTSAQALFSNNKWNDESVDSSALAIAPKTVGLHDVPPGTQPPSGITFSTRFIKSTWHIPTRVFDCVEMFGADPKSGSTSKHGVVDSGPAIQKCLDAAATMSSGAVAYLPQGRYRICTTINVQGDNFTFGGSGWHSQLVWGTGCTAPAAAVVVVGAVRHVAVEQICILNELGGAGDVITKLKHVIPPDLVSATFLKLDGIYVDEGCHNCSNSSGVHLVGLGSEAAVHAVHIDGNLRVSNSSLAKIIIGFLIGDAVLIVDGMRAPTAEARGGMLGVLMMLGVDVDWDVIVKDDNSLVVADLYEEQQRHHVMLCGGDCSGTQIRPNLPSESRVTVQGIKCHTCSPEWLEIRNWSGSFFMMNVAFFGGIHDGRCSHLSAAEAMINDADASKSRWQTRQSGSRPLNLTIAGSVFMTDAQYESSTPIWHLADSAKLSLLGNLLANYSDPTTGGVTGNNKVLQDESWSGTNERIIAGLDDFRRLGQLDLFFNHRELLSNQSVFATSNTRGLSSVPQPEISPLPQEHWRSVRRGSAEHIGRLRGTFVSLDSVVCAADWAKEVHAMARINMSTIITIASLATRGNETTAYFPSQLPFVTAHVSGSKGDCIAQLLAAAQAHGFTVHLGLELNYGFADGRTYTSNHSAHELFSTAAHHNIALMHELHKLYSVRFADTLRGFYDSNEINDVEWTVWRESHFYGLWMQDYLRPTHSEPSQLGLQSSNAPYFCHSGPNPPGWGPSAVSAFYRKLIADVGAGLEHLWFQDCVGVSTGRLIAKSPGRWFKSPAEVVPFYESLNKMFASLKPTRALWSDTEIFEEGALDRNYSAAAAERVYEQLSVESPYVGGAVSFAWQYLSPYMGKTGAAKLYDRYLQAAHGG